jgi:hypothetical protein
MTPKNFEAVELSLDDDLREWASVDQRRDDWPVVYVLHNEREVYVGETVNAKSRFSQHKAGPRRLLKNALVIFHNEFNKSACLNFETELIGILSADEGLRKVVNISGGQERHNFFNKENYQSYFDEILDYLHHKRILKNSVEEILNSELFKLSPFKTLNDEQEETIAAIVEGLAMDSSDGGGNFVVQGGMGTGKTVVGIYLAKLLMDIAAFQGDPSEILEKKSDSPFLKFFFERYPRKFRDKKIGIVIPMQALRKTVEKLVKKTAGLDGVAVLSPAGVGRHSGKFDLLIVDETHRLQRRANQANGPKNIEFKEINESLFGNDDFSKTQLDWIFAKSSRQVFLIDPRQSIRTADISLSDCSDLIAQAKDLFVLHTQERIPNGDNYVQFIYDFFDGEAAVATKLPENYLKVFDDFRLMRAEIEKMNAEHGLSRLVAGYAWPWVSKRKGSEHRFDINIEGVELRWNSIKEMDWLSSTKESCYREVGSVHTVQGYDMNYAGVIVGPELGWDPNSKQIIFRRKKYKDSAAMQNNRKLGLHFSDEEILEYVRNIYTILCTRAVKGTYLYICDPELREHFKEFLEISTSS